MRAISSFLRIFTMLVFGWLLPGLLMAKVSLDGVNALVAAGTIGQQSFLAEVGPLIAVLLGATPMLIIMGVPQCAAMMRRICLAIAGCLVPNLHARIQQGQQAIDTHTRNLLEQGHAEGLWDLSGWNGDLSYTMDWGELELQGHPSPPLMKVSTLFERNHTSHGDLEDVIERCGSYDGLWTWQRVVVWLSTNTPWITKRRTTLPVT